MMQWMLEPMYSAKIARLCTYLDVFAVDKWQKETKRTL